MREVDQEEEEIYKGNVSKLNEDEDKKWQEEQKKWEEEHKNRLEVRE